MRTLATRLLGLLVPILALACLGSAAHAQGLLINVNPGEHYRLPRPHIFYPPHPIPVPRPTPPSSYKIKELSVQAKIVDQVAKTQVTQSFVNTGSVQMEVSFVFPLPYDGAIDQMTLLVDGKEYPAKLLPAAEARRIYEEIVRKNRDPALLEWIGTGMFQTSVFPVPPGAERKVTLRYSQLCRKAQGLTDYLFPLSTAKYTSHPVEKLDFQLAIESAVEIKNVYSPTHAVEIKRPDNQHAVVSLTLTNQVPTSDFRLLYDVGQGQVGASVISFRKDAGDDGFFLLLASPQIKAPDAEQPKKTVVFAVDRSGSMSGEKISQAKNAAKFVLNNLRPGDLFNIVAYDSQIESFRPELQAYSDETRKSALGFVEGLFAGGSTNIDGALRTALGYLKDASRPNFVIFLTDGLPTDGETNEARIVANAKSANAARARVFTFGVGYDVNSRLLDKLVRENFGQSEYVRPNENIETSVSSLYRRVSAPVLSGLSIRFTFDSAAAEFGEPVNRLYPGEGHDLFAGEQLVVVGRYKRFGAAKVSVVGKVGAQEQRFDFPATLVERSPDESNAFIEKLWAARRVGEILDQLDLKGKNEELVKELVQLATRHGIMTPYTAFIADDRPGAPRDLTLQYREAERNLDALSEAAGESGFSQRLAKGELQRAGAPSAATRPSADGVRRYNLAAGGGGVAAKPYYYDAKKDKAVEVDTVQQVGNKTFYRRGDRWVDSTIAPEREKRSQKIDRYSREYFELVDKHGRDAARYLAMDEAVLIDIGGTVYELAAGE